jgi:hypothetical protein
MGFNRYVDREFDKNNPRTALREIPSAIIQPKSALIFVIINAILFMVSAYFLNSLCFILSPIALVVVLGYSLTKRFTHLSHLFLGLGLALAPIGAFLSVTARFELLPLVFSFIVIFWVAGFDILYSLQDVEFDKTTAPFKINLYPQNKPKVLLVADAGYGQQGTKENRVPDPPMYWIDNANFVYSNFNKDNTEISFFKVNVESKSNSLIGKVAVKPESQIAQVQKASNTQAIFFFGSKQILIDIAANTVTDLQFTKADHGFSFECKTNSYGHIVKLNDKDIGKYHFQPKNFKTETNIASIVKELVVGSESYQQGMAVWNFNKQGWESVDSEDVLTLVGWIKE